MWKLDTDVEDIVYALQKMIKMHKVGKMPVSKFFIHVVADIVVAAPQSMIVETVVGNYESVKCNKRIGFGEESINDILFIKMNLPPLSTVDLRPVIGKFMTDVRRRTDTKNTEKPEKKGITLKREFYQKFFPDCYKRNRRIGMPDPTTETTKIELELFQEGFIFE